MVTTPTTQRNEIISAITEASGQTFEVVDKVFEHVAIQDLLERDPTYLGGATRSLVELASARSTRLSLNVFTPTAETHGWECSRTVVQVCTDDSPFLVDSITAAISDMGYRVHLFIHPIMPGRGPDGGDESWMHIEITRLGDEQSHDAVRQRLVTVLDDVAKAVGDRSEEHTSELQSRGHLVCRLLLEKKKNSELEVEGARRHLGRKDVHQS